LVWLAYAYVTDGSFAAELAQQIVKRYLPGGTLWMDKVLVRPFLGQAEFHHLVIHQEHGDSALATIQVPIIVFRTDLDAALKGQLVPREITLTQPRIRLKKQANGRWNLMDLLADPWPGPLPHPWPTVQIQQGQIELHDGQHMLTILHDASLRLMPGEQGWLRLEGEAQGDSFERAVFSGWIHGSTGEVILNHATIRGALAGSSLRDRIPPAWRSAFPALETFEGRFDLVCQHLAYKPGSASPPSYEIAVSLHDGTWSWPELPFPLNRLTGQFTLRDGRLDVDHFEGQFGNTVVRVLQGTHARLVDPVLHPWDLKLELVDLELDAKIRKILPADLQDIWDSLLPRGRDSLGVVRVQLEANLPKPGADPSFTIRLGCQDVSIQPESFPYLLEHVRGEVTWRGDRVDLDLATVVGGQPLIGRGSIQDPTSTPRLHLEVTAGSLPIDQVLLDALPEETRKIVQDYQPAGTIRGKALITVTPETGPDPRVVAELDLDGVREVRWSGLPYPVRRLSGKLLLHPDRWIFRDLKGENGLARLTASGQVDQPSPGVYAVDLKLEARHLKFDRELRSALPTPWQSTWGIINPVGSSNVDMHVVVKPGMPDQYRCRITPDLEDETRLHIKLVPITTAEGKPGRRIDLPPLEQVRGTFDFDNGQVRMQDVRFVFREAPVQISRGDVILKDSGQFDLKLQGLAFRDLRFDSALRSIMPEGIGIYAAYLDDGLGFTAQAGLLEIKWSGRQDDPAVCVWDQAEVEFIDNTIKAIVPIEHLQGRIRNVSGRSDGRTLAARGVIDLESVRIQGQQLTALHSSVHVGDGWVRLPDFQARVLGGVLRGILAMTFESTPSFDAQLDLAGALLEEYARTLPGKQDFQGRIAASLAVSGRGADVRSLRGKGNIRVTEADLGKLPVMLRLIKPLELNKEKAAFDRADIDFTIQDGLFTLDPMKVTGNTISLLGRGTISPMGELDARLKAVYGRDERFHIPGLSDATREASGQFLVIHASGPVATPQFKLEVMPGAQKWAEQFTRWMTDRDQLVRPAAAPPRAAERPRLIRRR
jgi:hypothetical protein